MDRWTAFRKTAIDFLALPLIALSAVLCIIEGFSPLKSVDFSVFFAALFALLIKYRHWERTAAGALLMYCAYALADAVTPALAAFCGQHPILYAAVNNVYSLCFGNRLEMMVLHTDCSGAVVTAKGILTGAADMIAAGIPSAEALSARWLNGAYLSAQFLTLGGATFLWRQCDKRERLLLPAVTALSVLTGDCRLFSLVLLLFYPAGYPVYLLLTSLGYLTAALLGSTGILFALCGAVLAVLFYFTLEWWRKKYGFTQNVIRQSRREV